jgi:pimeloyl-ACP methyl ester carboxylesterase
MEFVKVHGQKVAYAASSGTGPAVLLVHGNSSSSRIWQRVIDGEIGRRYRLVAIDLPGHGNSEDSKNCAAYSIPGYAEVVRALIEPLSLQRAVFVGWSLGGHAVLEAAPELMDATGFMIFGTPPIPYPPPADMGGAFLKLGLGFKADWTAAEAREYVADLTAEGQLSPEHALEDALRTDGRARSMLAESIEGVGFRDEMVLAQELSRPLAVLHGADEQIVALQYLENAASSFPTLWQRKVQVIDKAGHALQWEQPEAFSTALDAFVQHCQGA